MKLFIVFSALVVAVSASGYGQSSSYGGSMSSGVSNQFREDDSYGNYRFGYDEAHSTGSTSRREEETNGVRRGSYSLTDADGRRRTVNYVADHTGFHATVDTNEPGTESKSSADVIMNGAQPAAVSGAYATAPRATYSSAQPTIVAPVARYSAPAQTGYQQPAIGYQQAPRATYSAPAPLNIYSAPAPAVATYSAPAPASYAEQSYEAPAPRAFSYSFSSAHPSQASYAPAAASYGPAPMSYSAPAAPLRAATYATQIEAPRTLGYGTAAVAATSYRGPIASAGYGRPSAYPSQAAGLAAYPLALDTPIAARGGY